MNNADDVMARQEVQEALKVIGAVTAANHEASGSGIRIGYGLGKDMETGVDTYIELTADVITEEYASKMAGEPSNKLKHERVYDIEKGKDVTDEWDSKGKPGSLKEKKKWGF